MIKLDVEQGSPEWFAARCGIPTASNFNKIFTSKGEKSASAKGYMNTLIAESLTGEKTSFNPTKWMKRGTDLEDEARNAYEFITDSEVETIGLVYRDENKKVSCSPDGGLLSLKGLEIKCPSPGVHVSYLLGQKLPTEYVQQVQGSMWVTGLQEWDFMSYHPGMKPFIITVPRNERLMVAIEEIIGDFNEDMAAKKLLLTEIK